MARAVLLFDGECGLCRRVVLGLLRLDRAGRLHFAPLQSAPAQAYLAAQGLPTRDFDSLVFVPDWDQPRAGDYRLRTDGAAAACRVAGGFRGRLLAGLRIVPRAWRDAGYRWVARRRTRLFGRAGPEPWTRPEWAGRFLAS